MAGDSKNQSYNNKESYKVWYFNKLLTVLWNRNRSNHSFFPLAELEPECIWIPNPVPDPILDPDPT